MRTYWNLSTTCDVEKLRWGRASPRIGASWLQPDRDHGCAMIMHTVLPQPSVIHFAGAGMDATCGAEVKLLEIFYDQPVEAISDDDKFWQFMIIHDDP